MACDPNELSREAACFNCLPQKTHAAIDTFLLCQIKDAVTGGDSGSIEVTQGTDPWNIATEPHSRSTANEQVNPLVADEVFEGSFVAVDQIEHFEILYAATTPYTAQKIWSNDGVNPVGSPSTLAQRVVSGYNVVYDVNEGRNEAKYVKLKITNGTTPQGPFPAFITRFWLIKTPYAGSFVFLDAALTNLSKALLTRSVLAGTKPGGTFANVAVDEANRLKVAPKGDYSIFGAQVVEQTNDYVSVALFTTEEMNIHTYDMSSNGGSTSSSSANLVVESGVAANGDGFRISKSQLIYVPGHEGRGVFTAVFDAAIVGSKQQIGLLSIDQRNGIYLEKDGTSLSLVHMRAGVIVSQTYFADWNGEILTSFTKGGTVVPFTDTVGRVYKISFGYLGYLGIELSVWSPDKINVLAHRIYYDNEVFPLADQVTFSVFARVIKTSGASNVTLKSASWEAASLGPTKSPFISTFNSTTTALGAGGVFEGDWASHELYLSEELVIQTDQVSASDGIDIEFSERGDPGAVERSFRKETFNASDVVAGFKTVVFPPNLSFTKIRYTNGGTPQGHFFMQLRMHKTALELSRGGIEGSVSAVNTAIMTRTAIFAANPSGVYANIGRGTSGGVDVGIVQHEVETPIKSLSSVFITRTSMTAVATRILSVAQAGRRSLGIKAVASGSALIYLYHNSTVSSSNGYILSDGQSIDIELDDSSIEIWGVSSSGTQAVSVIEAIL